MPTRPGDVIRVSTRNGQSYADCVKEMKANVNPIDAGLEILTIQRSRKGEVLLVPKKRAVFLPLKRRLARQSGRRPA